jgi:hypothetical protein
LRQGFFVCTKFMGKTPFQNNYDRKDIIAMVTVTICITVLVALMVVEVHAFLFEYFFHTQPSGQDRAIVGVAGAGILGLPIGLQVSLNRYRRF